MKKLNPDVPGLQGNFSLQSEIKNGRIEDTRPMLPGFERDSPTLTPEEQELEREKERGRKTWKELKKLEQTHIPLQDRPGVQLLLAIKGDKS